jgi:predicted secreted protein
MGTKVNLEVPDNLHLRIKREQLNREIQGSKVNLRELYYEILEKGIEVLEEQKKASQH